MQEKEQDWSLVWPVWPHLMWYAHSVCCVSAHTHVLVYIRKRQSQPPRTFCLREPLPPPQLMAFFYL
jgi:hypothetical protein